MKQQKNSIDQEHIILDEIEEQIVMFSRLAHSGVAHATKRRRKY